MKKITWRNGLPKKEGLFWLQWQIEYSGRKWSDVEIISCKSLMGKKFHYNFFKMSPIIFASQSEFEIWAKEKTFRFAGPLPEPVEEVKKENKPLASCCM